MTPSDLLTSVITLAQQAGEKILAIYQRNEKTAIKIKTDNSPVTAADLIAHEIINKGLKQLTPELPILSEESAAIPFNERKQWQRYWLIDPLDGTKEFIEHLDDFTVNIALIENHQPILGVVYAPALVTCYFASKGTGAFKQIEQQTPQAIHTVAYKSTNTRVVASRRHGRTELEDFLQQLGDYTVISRGSAIKCALVAEGSADVYPRLSPTSEWDIAAAQCIVEEAGGAVIDTTGKTLRYNTKESLLNPSFLAVGDFTHNWINYLK